MGKTPGEGDPGADRRGVTATPRRGLDTSIVPRAGPRPRVHVDAAGRCLLAHICPRLLVRAFGEVKGGGMAKNTGRPDLPAAPTPASPQDIRNVVLVGPGGAGKSALFERLVASRVGTYRPNIDGLERTTELNLAAFTSGPITLNLLDTPGFPDFVGSLRAGLRAADAAIFVVSAAHDIDRPVSLLWRECAALGMPRAIAVTHLDQPTTDFAATVERCRIVFGDVAATHWPVTEGGAVTELVDLLRSSDEDHSEARSRLIESVIEQSEDPALLDRYLEGEDLPADVVEADLRTAVELGSFFPVVPVAPLTGVGVEQILHLVQVAFPDPTARPLPLTTTPQGAAVAGVTCSVSEPLVAEVVRTTTDQYVGRLSLVRVFSGTLSSDSTVHVSGHLSDFVGHDVPGHPEHDEDERGGPLSSALGHELRPKDRAIAGDLVIVSKLTNAQTSDTLSAPERPVVMEPWLLPEPQLPVAIVAATRSDEDHLSGALARLAAEDVTLRVEQDAAEQQLVLWTMGQAHTDSVLTALKDRFGVTLEARPYRTSMRETFIRACTSTGRHVKQSGGHGQFAVCHVEIEPLERGAGVQFVDKVVGGAVPRQFIASVEKGVRAQLEKGLLSGHPVTDVRVTLVDGKAHSVDSSDAAFQTAGALAVREAASVSSMALLEPIDAVDITVADEHLGAVMADLRGRRSAIVGTEPGAEAGWTVVHAEVPQSELARYPIDLRSVSHGSATFTRSPLRHDYLPPERAKELIDALAQR